tara:strand:- start:141 stop:1835 length:1695 start_codon:yes stop_codon:yes gene_type:complete
MADDIKLTVDHSQVQAATTSVKGLGGALNKTSIQQGQLTKRSKKFSMGMQQAGFQVGDFAAQVQNGTSAMTALGQQGPQLLGIFGMWGALAGAALAIGTALAKVSMAGKEMSFDFKGISTDLGNLFAGAKPIFDAIGDGIKYIGGLFMRGINFIITSLAKMFTFLSYLPAIIKDVVAKSKLYWEALGVGIQKMNAKINLSVNSFLMKFKIGFRSGLEAVLGFAVGFGLAYVQVYKTAWTNIKAIFTNFANWFSDLFTNAINMVIDKANAMIVTLNKGFAFFGANGMEELGRLNPAGADDVAEEYENFGKAIMEAFASGKDMVDLGSANIDNETRLISEATSQFLKAEAALMKLREQMAKPMPSMVEMKAAMEAVGEFDLGSYFSLIKKAADGTKKKLKEIKSDAELARDALSSAMGSAMMDLVEGTKSVKDAFKSMASEIIKELYRIYVVKKITGMITTALTGSSVPLLGGKANGGMVSGGGSYLVGERGPEIFTPSMGGGNITPASQTNAGGVTIVQNINVSTGVQQTVRAEIRQMMPQIANSAKGAVLDAKRRGGSYGSAFA